jgi:hypothetical protein
VNYFPRTHILHHVLFSGSQGVPLATQGTSHTSSGSSTSDSQTTNRQTSSNAASNTSYVIPLVIYVRIASCIPNPHPHPRNVGAIAGGTVAGVVFFVTRGTVVVVPPSSQLSFCSSSCRLRPSWKAGNSIPSHRCVINFRPVSVIFVNPFFFKGTGVFPNRDDPTNFVAGSKA